MARHRLLWNLPFLLALLALLFNDHYWKWTYANPLTGKLSDLAGLILLPLLLAWCWPRKARLMPVVSGVFFLWWKSPWATPFLDWYNDWALIPLTRVVDYTDYWTLLVLPLVYIFLTRLEAGTRGKVSSLGSEGVHNSDHYYQPASILLALLTVLAFSATSPPYYYYYSQSTAEISLYKEHYKIRLKPAEILQLWEAAGYVFLPNAALIDTLRRKGYYRFDSLTVADSIFYRFPMLALDRDTVYNVQVSLLTLYDDRTSVVIAGLDQPKSGGHTADKKLKYYTRRLKRKLIRPLR